MTTDTQDNDQAKPANEEARKTFTTSAAEAAVSHGVGPRFKTEHKSALGFGSGPRISSSAPSAPTETAPAESATPSQSPTASPESAGSSPASTESASSES